MFEQAVLRVEDEEHFNQVKAALGQLFSAGSIAEYLRRLKRAKLRARDFEGALEHGLLGKTVAESYRVLGNSDRGQVREIYLSLVERIAPELRTKYLKLFAYY